MVQCTNCTELLAPDNCNSFNFSSCPSCGNLIRVDVFPAMFKEAGPGEDGEELLTPDEAGCYYHPEKKVAVPCYYCGRFLCALCDLEIDGVHLCPSCLEGGYRDNSLEFPNYRVLYDNIALGISLLSLFMWFLSLIIAPIVIYMVIYYWKRPLSIIPRTRFRFVLAFIISFLQIAGWSLLIFWIISSL